MHTIKAKPLPRFQRISPITKTDWFLLISSNIRFFLMKMVDLADEPIFLILIMDEEMDIDSMGTSIFVCLNNDFWAA